MEKIKGLTIEKLDFTLNKKGDFLVFEGPFLSHFYDDNGSDYLMLWVDKDSKYNRWLLFKTEPIKLYQYLMKENSLRKLFEISNYEIVYFIDIDNYGNFKKLTLTIKDNIPKDYLPQNKSFFDERFAENYGIYLKDELSKTLQNTNSEVISTITKLKPNLEGKSKYIRILAENNIRNTSSEILTLSLTRLAVEIHYEKFKSNEYQHLMSIHNSAYTNPIHLDIYFNELNRLVVGNTKIINPRFLDISVVLEKLIISTIEIVKKNPKRFDTTFNIWKNDILSNPHIPENISSKLNNFKI